MNDIVNNPYQAPISNVDMPLSQQQAGGTLEGGINGDYDFSIMAVLSEAWEKLHGTKWPILSGYIVIWGFSLSVVPLLQFAGVHIGDNPWLGQLISTVLSLAIYPCIAGVLMVGIRRAVDLPISAGMVFSFYGALLPLVVVGFIQMMLVSIGFLLLVIPGIYLTIAYFLVFPLVVEKKLSPWQALEASRKAITHQWFKMFGLLLILGVLMLVSAIPFGIGLIWTLPLMTVAMGIVYREIFGVEAVRHGE